MTLWARMLATGHPFWAAYVELEKEIFQEIVDSLKEKKDDV